MRAPSHTMRRTRPGLFGSSFSLMSVFAPDQLQRMTSNHQFFVCRYYVHGDAAVLARYQCRRGRISAGIDRKTEPSETVGDPGAHCRRVFAYAGRENECIEAPKRRGQHAGEEPGSIDEVFERECRLRIRTFFEFAHIVAHPGEPFQSGVTVEEILH